MLKIQHKILSGNGVTHSDGNGLYAKLRRPDVGIGKMIGLQ